MCERIVMKGEADVFIIFANGWAKVEWAMTSPHKITAQFVYQYSVGPHSAQLTHSLNNSYISIDMFEALHSNVNKINTLLDNSSASQLLSIHQ